MVIDYLGNWQQFIPELAGLLYAEWSDLYQGIGMTEDGLQAVLRERTATDRLPLTLVVVRDGEILGVGSLKLAEPDTKPGLSPWIGGLYIKSQYRGQGLGRMLVQALEAKASELGVERLYLSADSAVNFYASMGWSVLEHLRKVRDIALMSKALSPA